MGNMANLEGFLVSIFCELGVADEIPIISIGDDGAKWRIRVVSYLFLNFAGEIMNGGEVSKVKLVDRCLRIWVFRYYLTQSLAVGVINISYG